MLNMLRPLIPAVAPTLDGTFVPSMLLGDDAKQGEGGGGNPASTGGWIKVSEYSGWSFQITWTGTPTGNFVVEGSNDGVQADTLVTQAAGGAAGHATLERTAFSGVQYVRLNYAFSASTGTLTKAIFNGNKPATTQV